MGKSKTRQRQTSQLNEGASTKAQLIYSEMLASVIAQFKTVLLGEVYRDSKGLTKALYV